MDTVTLHDRTYHILEESKPYFLGRWFEKEIDGIPHMLATTDGAQIYFLVEGCTSFDLHFTDITHNHRVDITSQTAGTGAAFPILPPYLAVLMWQRTA